MEQLLFKSELLTEKDNAISINNGTTNNGHIATNDGYLITNKEEFIKNEEDNTIMNNIVDFPLQITSTDKGNLMLVTDAQRPGFRHHWSLHSRRNYKEGAVERFACIKCKNESRTDPSEKNTKESKVLFVRFFCKKLKFK